MIRRLRGRRRCNQGAIFQITQSQNHVFILGISEPLIFHISETCVLGTAWIFEVKETLDELKMPSNLTFIFKFQFKAELFQNNKAAPTPL